MEENNKYYIPNIEDFYKGFEYEMYDGYSWIKQVFPNPWWNTNNMGYQSLENSVKDELVRVKYLDADDIKSLGWKEISNNYFTKNDYYLFIGYNYNNIDLYYLDVENNEVYLFTGRILSVNELKKIFNFVGI